MDRLDAFGDRGLREALLYVRRSPAPVTAVDAAVALGVHRSVARSRLERLRRAGLLRASFRRRSGRSGPGAGRPAKLYSVAPESHAIEFPSRWLPVLAARLIDEIPARGREQALRRTGEDFGRALARAAVLQPAARPADGFERVCAAVRSLGFHAVLDRLDGGTAVISTAICPMRPLVMERPEFAAIDRGMWVGLLECGLRRIRTETVECETRSCLEGSKICSVVIQRRR